MSTSAFGETRSERKRKLILTAARAIFTREGFARAGMEQVARDAGVSTATLYAHFPGKAELFRLVVEETISDITARVVQSTEISGDARTRLTAFGTAYADFYCSATARATFRMVIAERRRFPELADHFQMRSRLELGGTLLALLRALEANREIVVERPSWGAGQFQGMIEHSTLILGLVGGDDVMPVRPLETIVAEAVETFLARYGVRERAA
ncbi:AcrR Transcriptional regulator [Caulobacteraceae bacterium]